MTIAAIAGFVFGGCIGLAIGSIIGHYIAKIIIAICKTLDQ